MKYLQYSSITYPDIKQIREERSLPVTLQTAGLCCQFIKQQARKQYFELVSSRLINRIDTDIWRHFCVAYETFLTTINLQNDSRKRYTLIYSLCVKKTCVATKILDSTSMSDDWDHKNILQYWLQMQCKLHGIWFNPVHAKFLVKKTYIYILCHSSSLISYREFFLI